MVAGDLGRFEYGVETGVNLRSTSELVGAKLGSEWVFAAAGGVRFLDDQLLVGPEVWGGTLIDSSFGPFDVEGTPIEALLGAHYRIERWQVGFGAGPGLSRGFGAPELRALASLEWVQAEEAAREPPAPLDRDGDGVSDRGDICPDEPAGASPDPARAGCPAPEDTDHDAIADREDACPNEFGEPNADRPRHGCPRPAVLAPTEPPADPCAGVEPGTPPAGAACPPVDQDADGIEDARDACPAEPGPAHSDATRAGCPLVALRGDQLQLLEPIEFENNAATLRAVSSEVLELVFQLLRDHPEIVSVDVQGHTDARGLPANNLDLSRRRAAAVRSWLLERGVAPERVQAHGFGSERPLDDNGTELGRQRNRRVEFHVERASAP
jgi:outer membrane protein OmpA-like peptidoglycan-associated protein